MKHVVTHLYYIGSWHANMPSHQVVSHVLPIQNLPNYIDGLVQDCSISIAIVLEIIQSYTKLSMYR